MIRKYRCGQYLGILMMVAIVGAGCSSSKNSSDDKTASNSGTAASSAKGTPINIGMITPLTNPALSYPEAKSGAAAAVAGLNAAGGVNGHPLKLTVCDSQLTANGEISCARQMVAAKVVAVVDSTIVIDQSGSAFGLLADAGIPYFAGSGSSPAELTSADSYPLASGAPGWWWGTVQALKNAKATKFAIYGGANIPAVQYGVTLVQQAMKALGLPDAVNVVYADSSSDPTLAAAAAAVTKGGVNGIILLPLNAQLMVKSLVDAGYKGAMSSVSVSFDAALKSMGSMADGILISSQTAFTTDTSNAAVTKFLADMKNYEPEGVVNLNSLAAYASVELFAAVAKTSTATTLTGAAFKQATDALATPIDIGLVGPWSIADRKPALASAPRILNPTIMYGVVRNGAIVSQGSGYMNPFGS